MHLCTLDMSMAARNPSPPATAWARRPSALKAKWRRRCAAYTRRQAWRMRVCTIALVWLLSISMGALLTALHAVPSRRAQRHRRSLNPDPQTVSTSQTDRLWIELIWTHRPSRADAMKRRHHAARTAWQDWRQQTCTAALVGGLSLYMVTLQLATLALALRGASSQQTRLRGRPRHSATVPVLVRTHGTTRLVYAAPDELIWNVAARGDAPTLTRRSLIYNGHPVSPTDTMEARDIAGGQVIHVRTNLCGGTPPAGSSAAGDSRLGLAAPQHQQQRSHQPMTNHALPSLSDTQRRRERRKLQQRSLRPGPEQLHLHGARGAGATTRPATKQQACCPPTAQGDTAQSGGTDTASNGGANNSGETDTDTAGKRSATALPGGTEEPKSKRRTRRSRKKRKQGANPTATPQPQPQEPSEAQPLLQNAKTRITQKRVLEVKGNAHAMVEYLVVQTRGTYTLRRWATPAQITAVGAEASMFEYERHQQGARDAPRRQPKHDSANAALVLNERSFPI
eukprot:SAG31_NODE_1630_length_7699_cov_36.170921_2_plen_510_part_00